MYAGDRDHSRHQTEESHSVEMEDNRRQTERRIHESKGYAYISMVGWMDRREKKRRQDDGEYW
jgi:hypothetical protein